MMFYHLPKMSVFLWVVTAFSCLGLSQGKPNVVFIMADDLRAEINSYHTPTFPTAQHPRLHTPNLDDLAGRSMLFRNAFVSYPQCTPSRTSFLTSRRPDTHRVLDLEGSFRDVGGNFTTLPQYFKQNGYLTAGVGKVLSVGGLLKNDPPSWTEPYYFPTHYSYWTTKNCSWRTIPADEYLGYPLPDQQIATQATQLLKDLAPAARTGEQPFFLAVGFLRPHLPFISPEKYFSYYPFPSIELPDNPYAPYKLPPVAWYISGELRSYGDIKQLNTTGALNTTLPDKEVLELRRAYYSAVTYIDDLVGSILRELEKQGLSDNTIVTFLGDHGFQLGEHAEWGKQTAFELALQAPLIMHIPGKTKTALVTSAMTEFIDIFPTLVEAAGLPAVPLCPEVGSDAVKLCREGFSMMPLIENPHLAWKEYVFSQDLHDEVMAYSVRSGRYRYTEWVDYDQTVYRPVWDIRHGVELYDHANDVQENYNRAYDHAYQDVIEHLSAVLHSNWRTVGLNTIKPTRTHEMKGKRRYIRFR